MAKSDLFNLFRDTRDYTITDSNGVKFEVRYHALKIKQRKRLAKILDEARTSARAELELQREGYMKQLAVHDSTRLIDSIIQIERVVVQSNADLAPNSEITESERAAALEANPKRSREEVIAEVKEQREKVALAKWEESRRGAVAELNDEDLRKMLCDRLIEQLISASAMDKFLEVSVCEMVLDPKTNEPLVSLDETADNHIDEMMPETKEALFKHWREFVERNAPRPLRETATDPDFLASGAPQSPAESSPGEMIATT